MFKHLKKLLGLVIAVFLIYMAVVVFNSLFPVKYSDFVKENAQKYNVEKNLIYGIIKAESGFDETVVSGKGAVGLMQIKEDTAKWCAEKMGIEFDENTLRDPETNIKIGVWYLSYLRDEFKSEDLAVIAYNAGLTHVKQWLDEGMVDEKVSDADKIPFEETRNYIKKVRLYKKIYSIIEKTDGVKTTIEENMGGK